MNKELIINATSNEVEIALVENDKLVEIHRQKSTNNFTVGDIFLGRIRKLVPNLMNAAFVDVGHEKDGFLHYTDLGPKLPSLIDFTKQALQNNSSPYLDKYDVSREIVKTGKIDQVLDKRFPLLVQISKEPISSKGPRLTCELTIPGRFIVLVPFSEVVAVSKKIADQEERKRLDTLIRSIKPKNFGVIVRTASEGKKVAELHEELQSLVDKWTLIHQQISTATPPVKLLSEIDKTSSILRDILTDDFNKIVVNDESIYESVKSYLKSIAEDKVKILHLHDSKKPIFEVFGINRQIKASFGKTATMNSGAYLVIEHTEAMHVIDVNSGPKVSNIEHDEAILNVNLEAAEEVARQLRLRDIGGLIIIDFIDMKNKLHRLELMNAMRDLMSKDRAQHTILPLSKFGLMQITRQRVRPEVNIDTSEKCTVCKGTGKVMPTILVTDEIERDIKFIIESRPNDQINIQVHPFVYSHLKRGLPNQQMKWYFKYKKWIKIIQNSDFSISEYKFFDKHLDEVRLS